MAKRSRMGKRTMQRSNKTAFNLLEGLESRVLMSAVNVVNFGAVANDGVNDTAAIQAAVNAAGTGGTVSFGAGRYNLSGAVILKEGQTYEGNNATLAIPAGADFALRSTAAISNVRIQGFNFEGGGVNLAYAGNGITIANNTFTQISGGNYRNNGIFIAGGLSNSAISSNRFFNNPGADNGILGFGRWNTVQVVDNVIDDSNEGIHIFFGPTTSTNPADHSYNVEVSRNTITHVRRIGIELQSLVHNLTVSGNRISDWLIPDGGHMALSVATTENSLTNNSTDVQIINNVLIGNGQNATDWNDAAIEAAGNNITISGNYVANWSTGQLVAVTNSWQTTNNTWAGVMSLIGANNGYSAPTLNSGNTVIAWNGTIPGTPTTTTAPAAPTGLVASANGSSQISLSWADNSTNETGYKIERMAAGGAYTQVALLGAGATSYTSAGLTAGSTYTYRVKATNNVGDSGYTNTASATTAAMAPPPSVGTGTGLTAQYFASVDLTSPVLVRTDTTVNFDWSTGSPAASVTADTFSARWTGQVQAQYSETYTLYTNSDDGVRLWVNGQLLIDNWTVHAPIENSGTIALQAGQKYDIKMEYHENAGGAVAQLSWSSPSQAKQIIPTSQLYVAAVTPSIPPTTVPTDPILSPEKGLTGQYFDSIDFTNLVLTRTDATVNFDWAAGSPDASVTPDTFSVRWTGQVQAQYGETYTFYTNSDDGVRLWVNGQLLIDNWSIHAPMENSGTIALVAGQKYDIKMEYYENAVGAVAKLLWSSASQAKQVVPVSQLYTATATPSTPVPTGPILGTGNGLQGQYFNSVDLTSPVLTRTDATVNFNWGADAPDASVTPDTYSVRWTGQVQARTGETYTFYTNTDDGVRLWVNGQLLVDNWSVHAPVENSGTIALQAGQKYDIRMEYYENAVGAVAQLSWSSPSQAKEIIPASQLYSVATPSTTVPPTRVLGTGLTGQYFDSIDFTNLVLTRTDATVNFDWAAGSPDASVTPDTFSVRWTGQVQAQYGETYTFYTNSDDGVRLWVNGQLLIDNWSIHAPMENSGTIALVAGQKYDIKMEYYENAVGAVAKLLWSSASQAKQVVPVSQLFMA